MNLDRSQNWTPRLEWREQSGSTNTELLELARTQDLPDFTVLATSNQTAGKGRAGRTWDTPPGVALAISVLIRAPMTELASANALGWLPLLAGLAMARSCNAFLPTESQAKLKWPNDVLVGDKKLCGVLSELHAEAGLVVLGAGVNLTQTADQLPIAAATSLTLAGAALSTDTEERLDTVLSEYLENLAHWYRAFKAANFDADGCGLRQAVIDACATLGQPVRAILPGDTELVGLAVGIDAGGRLLMEVGEKLTALTAGDIVHLRH